MFINKKYTKSYLLDCDEDEFKAMYNSLRIAIGTPNISPYNRNMFDGLIKKMDGEINNGNNESKNK